MPTLTNKQAHQKFKCFSSKDILHNKCINKCYSSAFLKKKSADKKPNSASHTFKNQEPKKIKDVCNRENCQPLNDAKKHLVSPQMKIPQITPEFILHEMQRNIEKLKDIYTSKENINPNSNRRQCVSSLGSHRVTNASSDSNRLAKNYESYRYSRNQDNLKNFITNKPQQSERDGKPSQNKIYKKFMDVVPTVPKGGLVRSSFDEKKQIFEEFDHRMKKKEKTQKIDSLVNKNKNSKQKKIESKTGRATQQSRLSKDEGHQSIKGLAQKLNLLAMYEFYRGSMNSQISQYTTIKSSRPHKLNKTEEEKRKKKKNSKSTKQKTNASHINLKKPDLINLNQQFGETTARKEKIHSNKNSSTKIYHNSSEAASRNQSFEEKKTEEKVPKKKSLKQKSQKFIKKQKSKQKNQPKSLKGVVEQLDFSSHFPEAQVSVFDNNMPIIEVEDSKQEVSSMILESSRKNKLKKDQREKEAENEEDSLLGCQIAKISQDELDNYELVSISL